MGRHRGSAPPGTRTPTTTSGKGVPPNHPRALTWRFMASSKCSFKGPFKGIYRDSIGV